MLSQGAVRANCNLSQLKQGFCFVPEVLLVLTREVLSRQDFPKLVLARKDFPKYFVLPGGGL
jgi:hypothetical protein